MSSELATLEAEAKTALAACAATQDLIAWNSTYLGDTAQLKKVGAIPKEERPAFGQAINRLKAELTQAKDNRQAALKKQELERSVTTNPLDVTLPGRPVARGRLHVASQIMRLIT